MALCHLLVKVNTTQRTEMIPGADTKIAHLPLEINLSPTNDQQRTSTPSSGTQTLNSRTRSIPTAPTCSNTMAGLQPSGNAAQIGGWTAFSNTSMNTGGVSTTQSTNNMTAQDQAAFANPDQLTGDAILNVAARYATSDIAENVNAAAGKEIMSRMVADHRLRAAVKAYAARVGQTPDQVRADLTKTRKAAGVKCNVANNPNNNKTTGDDQHTGDTTEDESEPIPANDQFLFINSERLVGETLLTLAERYSNIEISRNIAKRCGTDKTALTQSGVSLRMTSALKRRAKATKITVDKARANLHAAREANDVKVRAANGTRRDPARKAASRKTKVEPASQADVATATPADGMDTEMTDASSGDDQQGYTTDEVDAANALLLMFSTPSQEILDAAFILMDLYRGDGAETEDEASDSEMDDA
jgi:hypothetical protein